MNQQDSVAAHAAKQNAMGTRTKSIAAVRDSLAEPYVDPNHYASDGCINRTPEHMEQFTAEECRAYHGRQ